jgi:hypothetical protein
MENLATLKENNEKQFCTVIGHEKNKLRFICLN